MDGVRQRGPRAVGAGKQRLAPLVEIGRGQVVDGDAAVLQPARGRLAAAGRAEQGVSRDERQIAGEQANSAGDELLLSRQCRLM